MKRLINPLNKDQLDGLAKLCFDLAKGAFATAVIPPTGENQSRPILKDSNWVVAYGLCLFGLGGDNIEISIIPGIFRGVKRTFIHWLKELWP